MPMKPRRLRPLPAQPISQLPDPAEPEVVLLAVTGMSPAILTETIWALATRPEPVVPTRVVAITTTGGRTRLASLFQPAPELSGQTPWEALRRALERRGLDLRGRLRFGLTGDDVGVITEFNESTGATGELADIRSAHDHGAAADFILERVRSLASHPDTHLIGSIAGGRKTMGALLYAAFTLAARETDVLTHVLVNEPFETLPGFWFPAQGGTPLKARDGSAIQPEAAIIELAELSFVPLRNLFHRDLGRGVGSFSRLVEACRTEVRQRSAEQIRLSVHQSSTRIELNQVEIRLAPREQLVLLFFAAHAKQGQPAFGSFKDVVEPLQDFIRQQRVNADRRNVGDWRQTPSLSQRFSEEDIRRALSDLRRKLSQHPPHGPTLAACLPARGSIALTLPGPQIFLR